MKNLTDAQQSILDFISSHLNERQVPPTYDEICSEFGFKSKNAAETHVKALIKKGYLEKRSGQARGLFPVHDAPARPRGIPLVGSVAAGSPVLAEENIEDYIDPGQYFPHTEDKFCLKIRGDSMIGAGILPDDLVIIRSQSTLENGEIGAVILDNEAVIKKVFFEEGHIVLVSENEAYEPIRLDPSVTDVLIAGKLSGVLRIT